MSDADRWTHVCALFAAALEKTREEREGLIAAANEPPDVKDEVRALLAAHDKASAFLLTPTPAPLLAQGTLIGPYRVMRFIDEGGWGRVYLAEDTRLHRRVALKLLRPEHVSNDVQRERLKLEARAAAALSHPGIATVYALDEIDGQIVMVSEYVEGETLRKELNGGRLPLDRALDAALDIARAMEAAHQGGIIHRDLKPENIKRTKSGTLKVLDFGLAKVDAPAGELISKTLTEDGFAVGTPPYMAPEQLRGGDVDCRADHFAFGVMLYEMTMGRHPFGGRSMASRIAQILEGQPQPPTADDALPSDLWEFMSRCLQKERGARYATTRDLVGQLELLRSTTSTPSTQKTVATPSPTIQTTASTPSTPSTPSIPSTLGMPATPVITGGGDALWWWKFHQFAAAVVYSVMMWPVWHVHRAIGRGGLFFFSATLAAVVVAAILRFHLYFSSRVYPEQLEERRGETRWWIRSADVAFVVMLVTGSQLLPDSMAGWAALLLSVGIGAAIAFLIIEPGTARAAFRKR
jgi:serine/threonine protein kinase